MANMLKPSGVNNIWAVGGVKTDPGTTKATTGWVVELPPYQMANWIEFRQDSFIAHSNQHGIPEWDAVTEYQGNVSYTKGTNGLIYKCLVTNTNIDPVNPLNTTHWVRAFESYGSVAVVQTALNTHLTNYSTLAGISNVPQARLNLSVFSKVESDARFAALAGNASQVFSVATATTANHAIPLGQLNSLLTQATEAQAGIAAVATNTDVSQGTDDTKMVTPLKLATLYLSKAGNLAGLGNTATARTNLGLGSIATEAATGFLRTSNNLSDLASAPVARANLGLTSTATQPETYFLRVAQNLADVPNKATARSNLGLTALATTDPDTVLKKADNLSGLTDVPTARTNLGLQDSVLYPANTWLNKTSALGDITNVQLARNNLDIYSRAEVNNLTIGVNQTWQNVRGSRVAGQTYTNNTGRPITVLVQHYGLNTSMVLYLNGIGIQYHHSGSVTGTTGCLTVVVPAGNTYAFNAIPQVLLELR